MQLLEEKEYCRNLAKQVAELAHETGMDIIRKRWCDVNSLRKPDRAPVWVFISGCWHEFIPEQSLKCADQELRSVEYALRQLLIKREIDDDTPIEPFFEVQAIYNVEPENVWGVDIGRTHSNIDGGAWAYDPPLKSEKDFYRLRFPMYELDKAATMAKIDRMNDLLGDILPPKLVHETPGPVRPVLCTDAAELRGLEQMMLDTVMEPELLHRLMAHIRDAALQWIDRAEANKRVIPYTTDPPLYSDPIGAPASDGSFTYKNCWTHCNSQEFDQVSPDGWEEFCLNYQKPVLERFGLVQYGCCENLTKKIDGVLSIPNLRMFVCSAWTNLDTVLERVSDKYVIMWRQKASEVIFADDAEMLRPGLESGASRLQGRPHQIILREIETLAGRPNRLHEWTRIARETAEKYA